MLKKVKIILPTGKTPEVFLNIDKVILLEKGQLYMNGTPTTTIVIEGAPAPMRAIGEMDEVAAAMNKPEINFN